MVKYLRILHGFLYEVKQEIVLVFFRMFNRLHIMDSFETIEYIRKKKCSVSRIGDGEIRLMCYSDYSIGFQQNDPKLVARMKEVLSSQSENVLLCLPIYLVNRSSIYKIYRRMWEQQNRNWYISFYGILKSFNAHKVIFGNASFTRPYMEASDKEQSKKIINEIRSLWDYKRVLIVEGTQTRLGVGNDLLENAQSVERILAPAKNAFEKYDNILSTVTNHYSGQLVLLALGPTATVLAYDLSQIGIQALDIGHVDLEYEWYIRGVNEKVAIANKYVNEISDGNIVLEEKNPKYMSQIIDIVR